MTAICVPLDQRIFISRYAVEDIPVVLFYNGSEADADGDVLVTMVFEDLAAEDDDPAPTPIFEDRSATHPDIGSYVVQLQSGDTAVPGPYKLVWSYDQAGNAQVIETFVQIGQSSPDYDALDSEARSVIELTNYRFADLFDSPLGGPNLQTYYESNFGRNRLAQLLRVAMNRLNTIAQPQTTYSLQTTGKQFPYDKWGGLLEQALYVETLKHLRRSYLEQPQEVNVNLARLDRQDYFNRWGMVLQEEQRDLKDMLDHFKIAHLGLGSPRVLVSGGVYGNFGPTRLANSAAARPRYYWRFGS